MLLPGVAWNGNATAADFGISGGYVLRERSEWNMADPSLLFLPPKVKALLGEDVSAVDSHHLVLWAFVRGVANFGNLVSTVASLDTTALSFDLAGDGPVSASDADSRLLSDGRLVEDTARDAAFVRELYADVVVGPAQALLLSVGKRRLPLLEGLVYDDYGVSAEAQWDFLSSEAGNWSLDALALLPQRTLGQLDASLLVAGGSLAWALPGLLAAKAGALWARDRCGLVSGMMQDMLALELMARGRYWSGASVLERPLLGRSGIVTLHASAEADLGLASIRLLGAVQVGDVTLRNAETGKETSGRAAGTLLLAEAPINPVHDLKLVPFLLRVSGARKGQWTNDRQLGSFVTLSPLFSRAAIFLGGEMNPALSQPDFRLLGLGARGVSAAGLELSGTLFDRLRLAHSSTVLGNAREGDGLASAEYGVELDTAAVMTVTDWLDLRAEFDVLVPGEFFPEDSPPMFRLYCGMEGMF